MNLDTPVRITLKGWLAMRAMKCQTLDDAIALWDDLTEEVRRVAMLNGQQDGIPALVLNDKGDAITLVQNTIDYSDSPEAITQAIMDEFLTT